MYYSSCKYRIFLEPFSLTFSGYNHHHLKNVLRLTAGMEIEALSGDAVRRCEIVSVGKSEIRLEVKHLIPTAPPAYEFIAYQCLLKREYMDSVIERYSELGVTNIVPVISGRSLKELPERTRERYNQIAVGAALRSGGNFVPEIGEALPLKDIKPYQGDSIFFYELEGERTPPKSLSDKVRFIIGPEGGFEKEEALFLKNAGFTAVNPTSRILKAETAATVFAALLSFELCSEKERL